MQTWEIHYYSTFTQDRNNVMTSNMNLHTIVDTCMRQSEIQTNTTPFELKRKIKCLDFCSCVLHRSSFLGLGKDKILHFRNVANVQRNILCYKTLGISCLQTVTGNREWELFWLQARHPCRTCHSRMQSKDFIGQKSHKRRVRFISMPQKLSANLSPKMVHCCFNIFL